MSDSEDLARKLWELRRQAKATFPDEISYEKAVSPFRMKLFEEAEKMGEPEDDGAKQPACIRAYVAALYVAKMTRDHAAEVMYGCALCDLLEWLSVPESDTEGDPG